MMIFEKLLNRIQESITSASVSTGQTEEDILLQSAERYRSLFNRVPIGLYRTTPEGEILDASPALLEMLGYPDLESMLKLEVGDIYVNASDRVYEVSHLKNNGVIKDFEIQLYRKDGKTIWLRDNARAVLTSTGQIACYEGSLEDITQRKQMEAAERDQRVLAEALRDTAAVLSSTLNFDEVLERILTNVGKVVPHETANIMLVESGIARVVRCLGYASPEIEAQVLSLRLSVAETNTLRQMDATGQPLVISETQDEPGWVEIQNSKWMRSYAGAPVKVKGETIGFVNLNSAETGFFSEEHAGRLKAFADQAAIAIENARLFGEVQKYARQMALLNDITRTAISAPDPYTVLQRLTDRLGELFESSGVYITLWDEERGMTIPAAAYGPNKDSYTSFRVEPGEVTMTESVLRSGRVLVVEDLANSPYISSRIVEMFPDRSMLGLPLIVDGKRLGAALISYQDEHHFSETELTLGEQVAGQIALAIYKAQLLDSERKRTEQLTLRIQMV
jgi:PAS domain S-box-containing protein